MGNRGRFAGWLSRFDGGGLGVDGKRSMLRAIGGSFPGEWLPEGFWRNCWSSFFGGRAGKEGEEGKNVENN